MGPQFGTQCNCRIIRGLRPESPGPIAAPGSIGPKCPVRRGSRPLGDPVLYFLNATGADVPGFCLVDHVKQHYDGSAGDRRIRHFTSVGVHLWQIYRR